MHGKFMQAFCLLLLVTISSATAQNLTGWVAFNQKASPDDLNTVYFANSERGWIGGDKGFLAQTKDGGKSWNKQILGTLSAVNDVYFRGNDKGYVLAGDRVFTSTDGGQSWREEKIFREGTFDSAIPEFYSLRFANKKKGWIVGSLSEGEVISDSLMLQTDDGGTTWRKIQVPTTEELIHLDFINETKGWVVGAGGTILATADGGQTWKLQQSKTIGTLYHVDFKTENLGWAVGTKGTILRTEDGGKSWATIKNSFPNTLLSVEFINEQNGWIVGRGGVILRSDDGGKSWIKQDSKTTQNLFALFIDKKFGWAVGTKGTILKYTR